MISFRFIINQSFLDYSTHPITVPKSQVEYNNLPQMGLDKGDFIIIYPKGERLCGHMYYGEAGYGSYYQLRTYPTQSIPNYINLDERVLVIVLKDGRKRYAIIEYRD